MNGKLETYLDEFEAFDASHHRPMRIMNMDDAQEAHSRARKVRKGRKKRFNPDADPFRRGMTWRLWNTLSWTYDIVSMFNTMNPGYLAHLAEIDPIYSEPLRERWEMWCRDEANYIPQPRRPSFWDWWQGFVEAGELDRFKFDIGKHHGGIVRPYFADVFCEASECQRPNLAYQVRYTLVRTDNGLVSGLIPTIDDKSDPAGEAGVYQDGYVKIRRRCPWCGEYNLYQLEVER